MTSPWGNPPQLPTGPRADDDPTGLRFDRADLEETTTATAGDGWAINGRGVFTIDDPLCGHLPGEPHDGACAYWRGVALSEHPSPVGQPGPYGLPGPVARPPFNFRQLAEQHITAADQDRRERGAA